MKVIQEQDWNETLWIQDLVSVDEDNRFDSLASVIETIYKYMISFTLFVMKYFFCSKFASCQRKQTVFQGLNSGMQEVIVFGHPFFKGVKIQLDFRNTWELTGCYSWSLDSFNDYSNNVLWYNPKVQEY